MTEELKSRLKYAGIAIVVVATTIILLGPGAVFILALLLGLGAWREYSRLTGLKDKASFDLWGYGWVLLAFTFSYFVGPRSLFWFWLAPLSAFALLAGERVLFVLNVKGAKEESPEASWKLVQDFTIGCLYVFLVFGFVGPIAMRDHGQQLLLTGIGTVVLADTAAYFGGRRWGKRKLWPQLSPGKTLEGAYCSFAGALLGALIIWGVYSFVVGRSMGLVPSLMIALLAAPLGILGDLFESLIKRVSGKKDSGALLPGHGGILDRADAFLFVFPLLYFLF